MHGMQLRSARILASVLFTLLTLTGAYLLRHVHFVPAESSQLSTTAFGYDYRGQPLSGVVYQGHLWKDLSRITVLWEGKRYGPEILWYGNGQRFVERHFNAGLEVGRHLEWFPDGRVRSLKSFENGLPSGEFFEWHPNGQLAQYIKYDNGREIVAKTWTSGGKPFYNYVWKDNRKIGLEGDRFCSPQKSRK